MTRETTRTPSIIARLTEVMAGDDKFAHDVMKTAGMITGLGAVNEAATLGAAPNFPVPNTVAVAEALDKDEGIKR